MARRHKENPNSLGAAWSDMSNTDKSAYTEIVREGGARDLELSDDYYADEDDPRPHGYEKLDSDLRVVDDGVEDAVDALMR